VSVWKEFTLSLFIDPLILLAILAGTVVLAEWLVKHTPCKHLGTALMVILIAAMLANLNVIPAASNASPLYDDIFGYLAPLAIFFLLLEVKLRDVKRAGVPMLLVFLLGAVGTTLGVIVASSLVDSENAFGPRHYALNGMFAGTYIGGSINFNALALSYDVTKEGELYAGAVVVDNIFTMIWMLVTLAIPQIFGRTTAGKPTPISELDALAEKDEATVAPWDLAVLMALGCGVLAISFALTQWLGDHGIALPMILILTTIALVLAQLPWFEHLRGGRVLGLFGVYLFLAVIGAFAEFSALANIGQLGVNLVIFVCVIVAVHGVVIFGVGRLLKMDYELIAIASQANIGGQTTAIALCRTFSRPELFLPAILVGSLGNGLGTYVGFLVAEFSR